MCYKCENYFGGSRNPIIYHQHAYDAHIWHIDFISNGVYLFIIQIDMLGHRIWLEKQRRTVGS